MKNYWFLLWGLFLVACSSDATNEEIIETFPVTKPLVVDTNTFVDYVADIYAIKNIEIRAKAAGYLEKIHVDEGAFVKEGQLLFSINNTEYREALAKDRALLKVALAEAKSAELELENTRSLVDKNVISRMELEFAKNKVQIAKAKVEEMQAEEAHGKQMLSYTEIRAPFSGTISRLPNKIGSLIEEGTLLTTLSQNDQVFAYFNVSEKEYLAFMTKKAKRNQLHADVQLLLANGELHKYVGEIETMDGQIDQKTGNLAIRARFNNSEHLLKHGASGKVRMEQDFKQVIMIPQKATFEIQDRVYVYVLTKDNKVKTRQIEVKARIPHFYLLSSGLKKNETIVYEGMQLLSEDMRIKTKVIPMSQIMNDAKSELLN